MLTRHSLPKLHGGMSETGPLVMETKREQSKSLAADWINRLLWEALCPMRMLEEEKQYDRHLERSFSELSSIVKKNFHS